MHMYIHVLLTGFLLLLFLPLPLLLLLFFLLLDTPEHSEAMIQRGDAMQTEDTPQSALSRVRIAEHHSEDARVHQRHGLHDGGLAEQVGIQTGAHVLVCLCNIWQGKDQHGMTRQCNAMQCNTNRAR